MEITTDAAGSGEHAEIELKLLAPHGTLERLREMPIIVQHARSRGAVRRLETVYYDTPERLLFKHGMSLRVRRSGKQFIQTLKFLPDMAQPLARRQWEAPVDGAAPDLARLPIDEVGDPVTTLAEDALVPVFATKVRRYARLLDLPGASVEIAFDEGTIEAGGRQEGLSEIELELKSGNAGALFDLGTQLLDAAPLQLGTRSKAERGYTLAFDLVQPAAKAELLAITAEHVVDDAVALLLGALLWFAAPIGIGRALRPWEALVVAVVILALLEWRRERRLRREREQVESMRNSALW